MNVGRGTSLAQALADEESRTLNRVPGKHDVSAPRAACRTAHAHNLDMFRFRLVVCFRKLQTVEGLRSFQGCPKTSAPGDVRDHPT